MNEEKNKKNIISLVVSILTLAVITIGTTFAFFSTVVRSGEQVDVSSASFKLTARIKGLYDKNKIIPTNDSDIFKAFDNECVDDDGWGACYAYTIELNGEGAPQDVLGKFKVATEDLPNLKYLVLDGDEKDAAGNYVVFKDIDYTSEDYETIGNAIHLEEGTSKKLIIVIWLSNLNKPQKDETNKEFTGYFTVESTLGSKITGIINASVDNS